MIKTSINAWSIDGALGFEETFAIVKKHGFDGIELNLDSPGGAHSLTMDTTDEKLEEIVSISRKYDLPVVSVSTGMYNGMFGDNDPAVREKAKDILRRQAYCAEKLGATGILIVPGGMNDERTLLQSWNNSLIALANMKGEVNKYKVKIDVENVWNGFFTSPFDMARFIDFLGTDHYGAYLDMGNMHAFSWTEYWVEILGSRIDKIHVKGFNRSGGINRGGSFVNVTEGNINWERSMKYLKETGFDGYLTGEVFNDDPDATLDDFLEKTHAQIQSLCEM